MFRKVVRTIVNCFLYVLVKIFYRVKIIGKENIPKNGSAILCGNHVHGLDAPIFIISLWKDIRFLAKEELFRNPFLRFLKWTYGIVPVDRNKKDTDAVKKSLKVLKNGEILGVFPEGTRNGMEKGVKPKNGAVNLSLRTGSPIIPFGVRGNFKIFHRVTYVIGKPIDYSRFKEKAHDKEFVSILTNELMAQIVDLRDLKLEKLKKA